MEHEVNEKQKGQFSKWVVVSIVALNVLFTVGVLAVFWHTASEPSVLVASWFAFTTGELSLCAVIKNSKLKKGGKEHGESVDGGQYEDGERR